MVKDALEIVSDGEEHKEEEVDECKSNEDDGVFDPLPVEPAIHSQFQSTEQMSVEGGASDAVMYLRRSKEALLRANRIECFKKKRRMLITELML